MGLNSLFGKDERNEMYENGDEIDLESMMNTDDVFIVARPTGDVSKFLGFTDNGMEVRLTENSGGVKFVNIVTFEESYRDITDMMTSGGEHAGVLPITVLEM